MEFTGWPAEGPALLAALAAENTREFWTLHRDQHETTVLAPMRAMAAALEEEFGPVRVFRPQVDRRFRPGIAPYRVDTGGVARSAGGGELGVVLSATALTVSAGHRRFDGPQLRRYRAAVDGEAGAELCSVLAHLDGLVLDGTGALTGRPRGCPPDHPRIALLRQRGLLVVRSWELGPWTSTAEPVRRVCAAWRAAAPLVRWLDTHVGHPDPVPARPRPEG